MVHGALHLLALAATHAWATAPCPETVAQTLYDEQATLVWLRHEVEDSTGVRAPVGFSNYTAARVPTDQVEIRWADGIDSGLKASVEQALVGQGFVWWPLHPDHQRPRSSPFGTLSREAWRPGHRTGSRSSVIRGENGVRFFGLKLPRALTDIDPKAQLGPDIEASLPMSNWMAEVDARLARVGRPMPEGLFPLRDVAAFVDRESGNGFLVRDLAPITTNIPRGCHWVPGFAVDQFGVAASVFYEKRIAAMNAALLIRYGYWPTSPHDQQYVFLIGGPEKGPHAPIATRDLGDGRLYWPVLKALGEQALIDQERAGAGLAVKLDTSARGLLAPAGVDPDRALRAEVFGLLDVPETPFARGMSLERFLESAAGQAAIRRYHGLP